MVGKRKIHIGKRLDRIEKFLKGLEATQNELKANQDIINEKLERLFQDSDHNSKIDFLFKSHMGNLDWEIKEGRVLVHGIRRRHPLS